MELYQIFGILLIHYISDFLFQETNWIRNISDEYIFTIKSKSNNILFLHVFTYSLLTIILIFLLHLIFQDNINIIELIEKSILYGITTFLFHGVTDYFTSRKTTEEFKKVEKKTGNFNILGLDQLLHYIQLFLTYYFIFL